jgi:serine/threonine-protein kinase
VTSDAPSASGAPPSSWTATVGDVVANKYQIQKILGRGGMGVVVAAMHVHLRERVALKVLLPSKAADPDSRARFLREARVTARLQNEHIAQVMDVGMLDDASPYFVMEYIEGVDLKRLLALHGPLEIPLAVNYVAQACEGIAEAHARGILHRDLKPSNLFLTKRYDGSDLIKVLDFGVSKASMLGASEDSYHTAAGTVLGSPAYMSPERLDDSLVVDGRSDVWSLSVILFELLAGRPPFWNQNQAIICAEVLGIKPAPALRTFRGDVPATLEAAVARGLERDLEKRTANVADLVEEILRAVAYDPRAAEGISPSRIRSALAQLGSTSVGGPASTGLAERYMQAVEQGSDVVSDDHSTVHERRIERPGLQEPTAGSPVDQRQRGRLPFAFLALAVVVAAAILGASYWVFWRSFQP